MSLPIFAGQVDNGGVFAAGLDARGFPSSSARPKIRLRKIGIGDAAPDIAPNAGAALFLVGGEEGTSRRVLRSQLSTGVEAEEGVFGHRLHGGFGIA